MSVLLFTILLFSGAALAGLLGSLTGLGGGVVLIPLLTLVFKVDIHYAIGTSLVSVIATSSGAAAAYVKEGITNIRLGMFLEVDILIRDCPCLSCWAYCLVLMRDQKYCSKPHTRAIRRYQPAVYQEACFNSLRTSSRLPPL